MTFTIKKKTSSSPALSSTSVVSPVFTITELLDLIFSFLSQYKLRQVVSRVNHQWYQVARSFIKSRPVHLDPWDSSSWPGFGIKLKSSYAHDKVIIGEPLIRGGISFLPYYTRRDWLGMMDRLDNEMSPIPGKPSCTSTTTTVSATGTTTTPTRYVQNDQGHRLGGDPIRARSLSVNLHDTLLSPVQVFAWFDLSVVTELTLYLIKGKLLSFESILRSCSCLLHLSLSFPVEFNTTGQQSVWDLDTEDERRQHVPAPAPVLLLRSLCLSGLRLLPVPLMRFLPWLGRLRKIELLTIRRGQGGSGFSDRTEKQNFWIQLAESCPELEAIHFSEELDLAFSIPMDLFPGVQEWGLDCETKNPGLMFKILADNKLEDRLTTLELLTADSQIGSQYASFSYTQRDKLLRRVLCSAPQLLHLKTGLLRISSHVFWDEQNPEWTIWACRGLRTLSMRLDGHMKYSATSRHVFGYLSRVCPRLEDLSIVLRCPTFALESGLCLLTRLQYLQRLEVISDYAGPHYGDRFPVRDFGWITEITNPPTPPKPKVVASVISSLVSSMTFKKRDTFDDRDQTDHISEDFQYCIDKNRASLRKTVGADNAAGKWKFSKIQWQQHDNHYRSDYDRIPFKPMVDGLEGLEYCGSLLDIDARLNSMLFALLTEQQKRKTQITDTIRVQLRATQPWPLLETLVLSFGSCCKGSGIELPSKLIEGQKILRKLRPDIAIFCRSESER